MPPVLPLESALNKQIIATNMVIAGFYHGDSARQDAWHFGGAVAGDFWGAGNVLQGFDRFAAPGLEPESIGVLGDQNGNTVGIRNGSLDGVIRFRSIDSPATAAKDAPEPREKLAELSKNEPVALGTTLHFDAWLEAAPFIEFNTSRGALARSLFMEPIRLQDGFLRVPEGPGIGTEPASGDGPDGGLSIWIAAPADAVSSATFFPSKPSTRPLRQDRRVEHRTQANQAPSRDAT